MTDVMSLLNSNKTFAAKLLVAATCGILLGFERRLRRSQVGMKTNFLICMGSMLFSHLGIVMAANLPTGDATRVISQIVTGVGFLGAGTIFREARGPILGLTSAALVWVNAAIGAAIGAGYFLEAIQLTLTVIIALPVIHFIEHRYVGPDIFFHHEMSDAPSKKEQDPIKS